MTALLVTGAGGMLGSEVVRTLCTVPGWSVTAATRSSLDVLDADAVDAAVTGIDVVVNTAAYTKVDAAEDDERSAFAVNAHAAGIVAEASARRGARLIHLSTDYVFDGQATQPYPEQAPLRPVSAYGRTKAEGERRVLAAHPDGSIILRTAWLYGAGGPNFVSTMLRLARTGDPVTVVDDQFGQPTWTHDVATKIGEIIDADVRHGVLHATSSGSTNWFGFARRIFEVAGFDPGRVEPVDSTRFARRAQRPRFSVLAHGGWERAGIRPIRDWQDALADALRAGNLE